MNVPITLYTSRTKPLRARVTLLLVALLAFIPAVCAVFYAAGWAFTSGALSTDRVVILHYDENSNQ